MSDDDLPRLLAAEDYARRDWAVIPVWGVKTLGDGRVVCNCPEGVECKASGKHAVETGWQHTEYRTAADLYPWWHPDYSGKPADYYNIGIRTGQVSRLVVLDVDGPAGYASLDTLLSAGEVCPTRLHRSGSGYLHLLHQLPDGLIVPNSASRLGPGLDVRGENGYIVAPPSVTTKGAYTYIPEIDDPVALPDGLRVLLERLAREKAAGVSVEAVLADPTFDPAVIPPHILSILGEVNEVGDRSEVIHNFVGQAMRAGFTQAQVVTAATPWCQATGKFFEHGRDRVAQGVAYSWAAITAERARLELRDGPDWWNEIWEARYGAGKGLADAPLAMPPVVDAYLQVREGRSLAQLDWVELFKADFTPRWLIPHMFEVGRQYSLYGGPGVGKSLIMFDFAAQLSAGRIVVDDEPVEPTAVAYFDRENIPADLATRAKEFGYEPEDLENLHYFLFPDIAINTRDGAAELIRHVVDCGAKMAVIDTLARFVPGVKENEAEWVTDVFNYAAVPLKARGITLVRLDHIGQDASKGARGTSAKLGDVDGAWLMTLDEATNILDFTREKTRTGNGPDHVQFQRTRYPSSHTLRGTFMPGGSGPEKTPKVEDPKLAEYKQKRAEEAALVPWIFYDGEWRAVLQPPPWATNKLIDVMDWLFGPDVMVGRHKAEPLLRAEENCGFKGRSTLIQKACTWRNRRIHAHILRFGPGTAPGTVGNGNRELSAGNRAGTVLDDDSE